MLTDTLALPEAWLGEYQNRYAALSVVVVAANGNRYSDSLPLDLSKLYAPGTHILAEGESLVEAITLHHAATLKHIFQGEALESLVAWVAIHWEPVFARASVGDTINVALENENIPLEGYETLVQQATQIVSHAHFRHIPELRISLEILDYLLENLDELGMGVDQLIVATMEQPVESLNTTYQFIVRRLAREQRKFQQAKSDHLSMIQSRCISLGRPLIHIVNSALFNLGGGSPFAPAELCDEDWPAILATLEQLSEHHAADAVGAATLLNYSRELNPSSKTIGNEKVILLQRTPARICHWAESAFEQLTPEFYQPSSWELLFS